MEKDGDHKENSHRSEKMVTLNTKNLCCDKTKNIFYIIKKLLQAHNVNIDGSHQCSTFLKDEH